VYFLTGDLQLAKTPLDQGEEEPLKTRASQLKELNDVYESVTESKDPFSKHFSQPRLFVVRNDGSGFELLTKEQLDYYFRTLKHSSECLIQKKDIIVGNTPAKVHYFLSKMRTQTDREQALTHLRAMPFPQNALYALLHLKERAIESEESFLQ